MLIGSYTFLFDWYGWHAAVITGSAHNHVSVPFNLGTQ